VRGPGCRVQTENTVVIWGLQKGRVENVEFGSLSLPPCWQRRPTRIWHPVPGTRDVRHPNVSLRYFGKLAKN
jgi:hypothetical protein